MTPIRKTKPSESPKEELGRLVDELGPLLEQLEAVKPAGKRADAIKEELRRLYDSAPAAASASIPGTIYSAIVSPRRMENIVNPVKLFKLIGKGAFLDIAEVTVKAFEGVVPLVKRGGLIDTDRTGSRTVTTALNSQVAKGS